MKRFARAVVAAGCLSLVLAGCKAEVEPNNKAGQAQDNNKFAVASGTEDFIGNFPAGDTTDWWRFNTGDGQLWIGGLVSAGHSMTYTVQHCAGLDYASANAWPTCRRWDDKWSQTMTAPAGANLPFWIPGQPSEALGVVVGCNILTWNGCDSAYRNHEHDWWRVRVDSNNGGGYGIRVEMR